MQKDNPLSSKKSLFPKGSFNNNKKNVFDLIQIGKTSVSCS